MKHKILITIFFGLGIMACMRGYYSKNDKYRPKKPKFSVLKSRFQYDSLIDPSKIYISTKKYFNYDGNIIIGYMGFYLDGRMIIGSSNEKELSINLLRNNSFDSSFCTGFYTTENGKIKIEFFVPDQGGQYRIREGQIKKDTIIFFETIYYLFKKEIRRDTLIKSDYLLK